MNAKVCALVGSLLLGSPVSAQAVDPATVGAIMTQRGTTEGYVDRARARRRGEQTKPAVSETCMKAWRYYDRMTGAQKSLLYRRCRR